MPFFGRRAEGRARRHSRVVTPAERPAPRGLVSPFTGRVVRDFIHPGGAPSQQEGGWAWGAAGLC